MKPTRFRKPISITGILPDGVIVRVVYSDESGVGSQKNEPLTVITAIVLNMDRQWRPVAHALTQIVRRTPKNLLYKEKILKGRSLYSAVRKGIPEAGSSLNAILKIIPDEGIPIFYAAVDRAGWSDYRRLLKTTEIERLMTPYQVAFNQCFASVDNAVRRFTNEEVLWIAERNDKQKESETKFMLAWHRLIAAFPNLDPLPQVRDRSCIADAIYFGNPDESRALQLVDVCCSTITRYLLEQFYDWEPIIEPYYSIIQQSIWNQEMHIMFRTDKKDH
jgi:hypothetical protein